MLRMNFGFYIDGVETRTGAQQARIGVCRAPQTIALCNRHKGGPHEIVSAN
jgi:hypothetical protein